MKQLFKATITIKYTENISQLDFNTVKDVLIEQEEIPKDFDLEGYISQFDSLINGLIKDAGASHEGGLEQLFMKYGFHDDREIKDLMQVWESEQDKVFSYLIKKNTSHKRIEKMEWSINNKFFGKKSEKFKRNHMYFRFKSEVNNTNKNKDKTHLTFELNEKEIQNLEDEFDKIENEISNLFEGGNEQQLEE